MDEALLLTNHLDSVTPHARNTAMTRHTPRSRLRVQVGACLFLHFALVLVHALLLVVWSHHYEHNATFHLNAFSTSWLPVMITSSSQLIGVGYLALLLLITQRLALRADFDKAQTLTAINDKSNAWQGLGSAVVSIYQQFDVPAAIVGVVGISLYLTCVFALHVSIPSMLHAENFEDTIIEIVPTTLANASFQMMTPEMYGLLPVYGQFPTLGLLDNMVYDIIPTMTSAVGNTIVNASIFAVDCAALPEAKQIDVLYESTQQQPTGNVTQYIFQLDEYSQAALGLPNYPAVWTSSNVTLLESDCDPTLFECLYPLIVSSTVPIVDSSGTLPGNQAWTKIQPQVVEQDLPYSESHPWAIIPAMQLSACAVSVQNVHINVSSETRLPVSFPSPPATAAWRNWTWPRVNSSISDQRAIVASVTPWYSGLSSSSSSAYYGGPPGVYRLQGVNATNQVTAPIIVDVGVNSDPGTKSLNLKLYNLTENINQTSVPNTIFDQFLCEDLELVKNQQARNNITLAELNLSLGRALASIYWYGRNYNTSDVHNLNSLNGILANFTAYVQTGVGEVAINKSVLRARLNLSLTPIIVGLVASTALFSLSFILVRAERAWKGDHGSQNTNVEVESTGVLHVAWLLGYQPLGTVSYPSNRELRRAGMHRVDMGHLAGRGVRSSATESDSELALGDEKDDISSMTGFIASPSSATL